MGSKAADAVGSMEPLLLESERCESHGFSICKRPRHEESCRPKASALQFGVSRTARIRPLSLVLFADVDFPRSPIRTTEDATAMQIEQSRGASRIVKKTGWRKGLYTTATCNPSTQHRSQSQRFAKIRWDALRSVKRKLNVGIPGSSSVPTQVRYRAALVRANSQRICES